MKVRKAVVALAGAASLTVGIGGGAIGAINFGNTNVNNHPDCDDNRIVNNGPRRPPPGELAGRAAVGEEGPAAVDPAGSIVNRNTVNTNCSARVRTGGFRVRF